MTAPSQGRVLTIAVGFIHQCRRPNGWLGRFVLRGMNRRHSKVTDWGLEHVTVRPGDIVLDVGCGGGRTIAKLAALAREGKVCGADFSETSVAAARRTNPVAIREGRVEIVQASVSALPFPDNRFDLVTAVETHYYWPDLVSDCREVRRVLKPGGTFALIAEFYRGGRNDRALAHLDTLNRRGIMSYALLTIPEHRTLLATAGFSGVEVFEKYENNWVCAVGVKES